MTGRVAIVTGGGGHIGSAVARALRELGATTVVLDLPGTPSHADRVIPVDLADAEAVTFAAREVTETFGRLDTIVHAAALVGTSDMARWAVPFDRQDTAAWTRALAINVTSLFVLVQATQEALEQSGHGSVVALGSIYGVVGPDMSMYGGTDLGNPAGYAVTKGGLVQLVRWLATALAPTIRVNCVSPGGVARGQPKQFEQRYVERTPLRRMATEEDIIGAVAYLASDLSAYVTGHNLVVDGGWTAW
jgi:NAD(P)-dependent dehydrogenase (short-subunit alcohol dehydrogenase family)